MTSPKKPILDVLRDLLKHRTDDAGCYEFVLECWIKEAANEIERLQSRWISVGERLPEPGESALVFLRFLDKNGTPSYIGCDGKGGLITVAALDSIDGQHLWTSEYGDETPTHWMPLPEPPANYPVLS